MENLIKIGISEMQAAAHPASFVTFALGSCIGICLYDKFTKTGALGHIMLPEAPANKPNLKIDSYANTCVPHMLETMKKLGCRKDNIIAKIAGGAKMFEVADDSTFGMVGQRNIEAVKVALRQQRIQIVAEDVGANYGRTVYFHTVTGAMVVQSFAKGNKTL